MTSVVTLPVPSVILVVAIVVVARVALTTAILARA